MLLAAKTAYKAVDTHSNLLPFRATIPLGTLNSLLDLERDDAKILAWVLGFLTLQRNSGLDHLQSYDARPAMDLNRESSFSTFWNQESRAKELFVHFSRVCAHFAKCCMDQIIQCPLEINSNKLEDLSLHENRRSALLEAVKSLPSFLEGAVGIDDDIVDFSWKGGWDKFDKLLPLAHQIDPTRCSNDWVKSLVLVADRLEENQAEVAGVMSKFLEKWQHEVDKEPPLDSRLARILSLTAAVKNNPGAGSVAGQMGANVTAEGEDAVNKDSGLLPVVIL
ncbi:hypothetical protein H1R20_g7271, partial [Candolleomyces eurysporus]